MNMPLMGLNKTQVRRHLFHKRLALQFLFLNSILSSHYFVVRHYYSQMQYTRVFDFKMIDPCIWIHMILISHNLPVQTHYNNTRPTFGNFFGESKESQSKLHSIVLTLW